jgi:hypothetical protein
MIPWPNVNQGLFWARYCRESIVRQATSLRVFQHTTFELTAPLRLELYQENH